MPQESREREPQLTVPEKAEGSIESDILNMFHQESDTKEVKEGRVSRRRKWSKILKVLNKY